jgi:hypothetical protein
MCPGKLLILGDFNYHIDDLANKEASDFIDLMQSYDLVQHVNGSTHKSGHTLDLMFSRSHDSLVMDTKAIDYCFPDHFPVFGDLTLSKPTLPKHKVTYRNFKKLGSDTLRDAITASALSSATLSDMSLTELTNLYDSELSKIADNLAPVKTRVITVRPIANWYNTTIREAKQKRRRAERKWRKTNLEVHRQIYIECKNVVNALIDEAKQCHYQTAIEESHGNVKQLFSITNVLLGRTKSDSLPSTGSPADLCSKFADFFVEKVPKIRNSISADNPPSFVEHQQVVTGSLAAFQPVTPDEVGKIISSSPSKSCSLDPVPTPLVKSVIDLLKPVITEIVNCSLTSGTFPSNYKDALVTPVLKKPSLDGDLLKNYRPVSNLSFVSKVLEKVVAAQLTKYLNDNGLAEPYQSAYRHGHSTETALLHVQNDIVHAVGQRKTVLLILLDLSAAFDTVNHEILKNILQRLGIKDIVLKWLSSYLEHRHQTVKVQSQASNPKSVDCGVPQGSVLGPVLFTLYTASLGTLLRSCGVSYHLYADDTQIWVACNQSEIANAVAVLENCVTLIRSWMSRHQLKLNEDKTEFLVISGSVSQTSMATLHMGGHQVTPSSTASNLGVTMDSKVSMEADVASICRSSYLHS